MAIYCFDIDGTICNQTKNYKKAKPMKKRIEIINKLYDQGHTIIFNTARGMNSGKSWETLTKQQLEIWDVKYHKIYFKKPSADFYIDDKAEFADNFFNKQ